jgi:hypothetical protein
MLKIWGLYPRSADQEHVPQSGGHVPIQTKMDPFLRPSCDSKGKQSFRKALAAAHPRMRSTPCSVNPRSQGASVRARCPEGNNGGTARPRHADRPAPARGSPQTRASGCGLSQSPIADLRQTRQIEEIVAANKPVIGFAVRHAPLLLKLRHCAGSLIVNERKNREIAQLHQRKIDDNSFGSADAPIGMPVATESQFHSFYQNASRKTSRLE